MCLDSFCSLPVYFLEFSYYKTCFLLIKKKKKKCIYMVRFGYMCMYNRLYYFILKVQTILKFGLKDTTSLFYTEIVY